MAKAANANANAHSYFVFQEHRDNLKALYMAVASVGMDFPLLSLFKIRRLLVFLCLFTVFLSPSSGTVVPCVCFSRGWRRLTNYNE